MVDEIETGTKAGDADQNTGEKAQVDGQSVASSAAEGNQQKEADGLKAGIQAEREKRQATETENATLKQQLELVKANPPQQQTAVQPKESAFLTIAKTMGYDPEYMTPAETGNVMDQMLQLVSQSNEHNAFIASHADFNEVVGKVVNGVFQESTHLAEIFNANPGLRRAFTTLGNTASANYIAYEMVTESAVYKKAMAEVALTDEQKAELEAKTKIDAANKTASISAAQGGGNVDRAGQLATLTDAEFKVVLEKKKAEAR